ncbi:hypothetical protein FQN51_001960 [Onygenales sp. PD_10]|nr:hypothetical protein FQN51_001960 [Onygenales sp. PD_10]
MRLCRSDSRDSRQLCCPSRDTPVGQATARSSTPHALSGTRDPVTLELSPSPFSSVCSSRHKAAAASPRRFAPYIPPANVPIYLSWLFPLLIRGSFSSSPTFSIDVVMVFPGRTSPLRFEPLSPTAADRLSGFSDSDEDLDDAARSAKRRRIERLGQDYLEGKPLFILSASLRGPFGNGWVNPWRKSKDAAAQSKRPRQRGIESQSVEETIVIPESAPKTTKPRSKPVIFRQGSGFESQIDPDLLHPNYNQQRCKAGSKDRRQSTTDKPKHSRRSTSNISPKPPSGSNRIDSPIRRPRSISHHSSNDSWLKKDRKRPNPQVVDPPQLSSPTPTHRAHSAGAERRNEEKQLPKRPRVENNATHHPQLDLAPISFTPINRRSEPASTDNRGRQPEKQPLAKESKAPENRSRFSKPGKPASALTGNNRNKQKISQPKLKKSSSNESAPTTSKPSASLHVVPSSEHLPGFEYRRADRPIPGTNSLRMTDTEADDQKKTQSPKNKPGSPNQPVAGSNKDKDTFHNSAPDPIPEGTNDTRDQHSTASEIIPSAQVIPEHSKISHPVLSLYSTNFSGPHNSISKNKSLNGGYDDQWSTQAAVAMAQKSLQEDLATPAKEKTSPRKKSSQKKDRHRGSHSPKSPAVDEGKKPLDLFDTPNSQGGKHNASTQTMINSITPFDFSTVKRVKPGRILDCDATKEKKPQSSEKQRKLNGAVETSTPKSTPPVSSPRNKGYVPPPLRHYPSNTSTNIPPPEDSSSNTVLPFNFTASTNATRQQDGQGGDDIDNFDISQAIADAGTFLQQSWDFERIELNSNNMSNRIPPPSSSSGLGLRPIMKP